MTDFSEVVGKVDNVNSYGTGERLDENIVGSKEGRQYHPNYCSSPIYWTIFLSCIAGATVSIVYLAKYSDSESNPGMSYLASSGAFFSCITSLFIGCLGLNSKSECIHYPSHMLHRSRA